MRASLLVVAVGSAMALSALGCRTSDAAIPAGVAPADGGGYCCPTEASYIPCAPAYQGGWSATAEGCERLRGGVDAILVSSIDEHGCMVLGIGPCSCLAPMPQPAPEAGPASSCYPNSSYDFECANTSPVCSSGNHAHLYGCTSGAPTASDCVTFKGRDGMFCCSTLECVRHAENDWTCSTLGVAYSCPVSDGGVTASGPGTCSPVGGAYPDSQMFCCK